MAAQAVSQDSLKLLNLLRAEIRVRHYSIRTEEVDVDWARRFILYHDNKHPKDMGVVGVATEDVAPALNYRARNI
ncbi:MAG: phage integrase N-terminal SAM-like domain-containing protein [Betaproteobacteria bacterium]|nr:phage integrase N-terminal SAM-like domain-containing protein [Betaproteobacteria bacterium]